MRLNNLKVIGLTGGIASGKSTVSNYLISKGFKVIDADALAREVVNVNSFGLKSIIEVFGQSILDSDGSLNRKKLRKIVFNDKEALKVLESITHPLIIERVKEDINKYRRKSDIDVVFLDCPLLFEMSLEYLVDDIWLVSTTFQNQIERIIERDGMSASEAKKIIDQQMSLEDKADRSNIIIENNSDLSSLKSKIDLLLKERC